MKPHRGATVASSVNTDSSLVGDAPGADHVQTTTNPRRQPLPATPRSRPLHPTLTTSGSRTRSFQATKTFILSRAKSHPRPSHMF